jgi:hypothetical protein
MSGIDPMDYVMVPVGKRNGIQVGIYLPRSLAIEVGGYQDSDPRLDYSSCIKRIAQACEADNVPRHVMEVLKKL